MIQLEDLKKIEASPYAEQSREGVLTLSNRLFWVQQDIETYKNERNQGLSENKLNQLKNYMGALRQLVKGNESQKGDALKTLEGFSDFLQQNAFDEMSNSPNMLKLLVEVDERQNTLGKHQIPLKEKLYFVSSCLEMDLDLKLSPVEQKEMAKNNSLTREEWEQPYKIELPDRENAVPGSWSALFYSLTDPGKKKLNPYPDVSVYEHKCSDNTMRRMAALLHMQNANMAQEIPTKQQLTNEIARLRKNSLINMTLRNEHTVELLRRGNRADVAERLNQTKNDFSFKNRQELLDAQTRAKCVLKKMQTMEGKAASSQEFTALKTALKAFTETDINVKNLPNFSADVLVAVENFTKGRKNVQRSARAQECVNLALDALVSAVPNAAANPHVTPLIARFNEVRSRSKRVNLADFGAGRINTVETVKSDPGYELDMDNLVEAMGEIHNGKIDPVTYEKVADLYNGNHELSTLRFQVSSNNKSYRNAAVKILEELTEDPAKLEAFKRFERNEVMQEIQNKAEEMSMEPLQMPVKSAD